MNEIEIRSTLEQLATDNLDGATLPEGPLDEHLDSVQRLTLVVSIEDHFEICFEPEDDEAAASVDDVIRIIKRHLDAG
jgi:acyl carrier protein